MYKNKIYPHNYKSLKKILNPINDLSKIWTYSNISVSKMLQYTHFQSWYFIKILHANNTFMNINDANLIIILYIMTLFLRIYLQIPIIFLTNKNMILDNQ